MNSNFDFNALAADSVKGMSGYVPGEQPKDGAQWVKLNTNEFPYPPSPRVAEAIISQVSGDAGKLRLYPDPISSDLRSVIADYFDLDASNAIAANGSDDLLNLVVRAFCDSKKSIAALDPSYSLYPVLAQIQGTEYISLDFDDGLEIPYEKIFSCGANVFIFTNPNAPTGKAWGAEEIEKILRGFKGLVIVDEAYAPFADFSAAQLVKKYQNLIVTGTMSKGWALAGMRVGWGLACPQLIEILDRVRDSYNLDRLAQAAAIAALRDTAYYFKFCGKVVNTRESTEEFFSYLDWDFPKSSANFIFVTPKDAHSKSGAEVAKSYFEFLKTKKILVRYFPKIEKINMSLRITIGTDAQMEILKKATLEWVASKKEQK